MVGRAERPQERQQSLESAGTPAWAEKWDFRTGSPHRVFRAIHDATQESGFHCRITKDLTMAGTPISDVATFAAEIKGEKDLGHEMKPYRDRRRLWSGIALLLFGALLVIGGAAGPSSILIAIGVVAAGVGVLFVWMSRQWVEERSSYSLNVAMKGETYKANAVATRGQATDLVADTRLEITALVRRQGRESAYFGGPVSASEQQDLDATLTALRRKVDGILPSLTLDTGPNPVEEPSSR